MFTAPMLKVNHALSRDLAQFPDTNFYYYYDFLAIPISRMQQIEEAIQFFNCGFSKDWITGKLDLMKEQLEKGRLGDCLVTVEKIKTQMAAIYNRQALNACLAYFYLEPGEQGNIDSMSGKDFEAKINRISQSGKYDDMATFFLTNIGHFQNEHSKNILTYLTNLEMELGNMMKVLK